MNNQEFGKFINTLRKEKGLTQMELAEKLNVSDKAVSRWENGKNYPDIEILENLGKELGVSVGELIACKKPETIEEAESITAKVFIEENNKTKKFRNISRILLIVILIILTIFFVPTSVTNYDDGGTKSYNAMMYKIVYWNKNISDTDYIHKKTAFYLFTEASKTIADLWKTEKLNFTYKNSYISDITAGYMNIGAEMPEIKYMDDKYAVIFGTCGVVIYDIENESVANRLNIKLLSELGYNYPVVNADTNSQLIYISPGPFEEDFGYELTYSISSETINRVRKSEKMKANENISVLNSQKRAETETNNLLTSWNCYNYKNSTAWLTADADWDMASLKLIIEENDIQKEYNIFK